MKRIALLLFLLVAAAPVFAQSSTEILIERKGVMGVKNANVFAPKYKERIGTYEEQIVLGLTRGWMTPERATHFRAELERLRKLEADAAAAGWAAPWPDRVDKEFTQFNIDFTKPVPQPAVQPAVKPAVKPATKPAAKPAAKPATKPAAAKKS